MESSRSRPQQRVRCIRHVLDTLFRNPQYPENTAPEKMIAIPIDPIEMAA